MIIKSMAQAEIKLFYWNKMTEYSHNSKEFASDRRRVEYIVHVRRHRCELFIKWKQIVREKQMQVKTSEGTTLEKG